MHRNTLKGMKFAAFGVAAAIACGASPSAVATASGGPSSGQAAEIRLGDVVSELRLLDDPSRIASAAGRGLAFETLVGDRFYPGSCATPLLLGVWQQRRSLPGPALALLDRLGPDPSALGTAFAPAQDAWSGSFLLKFRVEPGGDGALEAEDADLDGVADQARLILDRLQEAHAAVLALFEQTAPSAAPPDPVGLIREVEVGDLPGGLAAWVWPGTGAPLLVLDRDLILSDEGPAVLRHQIAHLFQISLSRDESPWWYEAHAVWAEDPLGTRAATRGAAVAAYLASARSGFEPDDAAAWEGAFLWPHFLVASGAPATVLGWAWEEMAVFPGNNSLQALDAALLRSRGTSLAEETRAFRIWNVFLGDLDDGNHYPFGADLPTPAMASVNAYPASLRGAGPLPSLGAFVTQLTASPVPGGWLLDFTGEGEAAWDVTLLTIPARLDEAPRLAELEIDDGGRAGAAVPWGDLAAVVAVVQNLGGASSAPQRFEMSARYDARVPFDLLTFTAEQEQGAVGLKWSTDREEDMAGWTIYRSRDPIRGFTPITTLLVPAAGGRGAASYLFLDADVQAGRKYYYLLEGVTRLGFTRSAHQTAVRITSPETPSRRR